MSVTLIVHCCGLSQDEMWSKEKDFFKEQAILQLEWASAKRKRSDGGPAGEGGVHGGDCAAGGVVIIAIDDETKIAGVADAPHRICKLEGGAEWASAPKRLRQTRPLPIDDSVIVLD